MTISNNGDVIRQFDGMKEIESSFIGEVNDEISIRSSSQGKQVSGTDNLNASDVQILPSQETSIRRHNQTHGETNINIKHAAKPGKEGFFSAIKNFFMGIFTKSQPELEIPDTVTVEEVTGEEIKVNGERFRGMLEALPMGEREGAAKNLDHLITERLGKGEIILQSVFSGKKLPPATTQDVSDLMLFIQLNHVALYPNESFTNGAYSIEDPEGKLADYLDSCKEGYDRSSSHLEGLQNALLCGGKSNAMRGIDIPGGVRTGLLDKRGTIHYGSIPKQEDVEGSTQRLFIQTERHGCRLSLRSFKFWTKSFWVNTSGREHRSMQFSDIGRAISNFFEKSDKKSGNKYRSEKLPGLSPKDIAETFKGLRLCENIDALKPYFSKNGTKRLPENARLSTTLKWLDDVKTTAQYSQTSEKTNSVSLAGLEAQFNYVSFFATLKSIKSKLIDGMYTDNPERDTEESFSQLLKSAGLNHPDRLGNEVMMSLNDLQVQNWENPQDDNLAEFFDNISVVSPLESGESEVSFSEEPGVFFTEKSGIVFSEE